MTGAAPEVSVAVVNWNGGAALDAMLASLEANPPSIPWDAVVIDNASRDGRVPVATGGRPWLRLITNSTNRGLAAANNQGLAATSGAFVLIANPDVVLPPGGVDGLVSAMVRHPRAAFVIPRLADPDGTPQTSAGDLPSLGQALLGRRGFARSTAEPSGFWWHGWDHAEERRIGRGAEACYLVRRSAVEDFGGQDERYRLDWEGIDWTDRARKAGWEVWLEPSVTVTHIGGVSISQAGLRWVVQSHQGMYRYYADRTSPGWRPLLAGAVSLRAVLKAAGALAGLPLYRWARGRRQP